MRRPTSGAWLPSWRMTRRMSKSASRLARAVPPLLLPQTKRKRKSSSTVGKIDENRSYKMTMRRKTCPLAMQPPTCTGRLTMSGYAQRWAATRKNQRPAKARSPPKATRQRIASPTPAPRAQPEQTTVPFCRIGRARCARRRRPCRASCRARRSAQQAIRPSRACAPRRWVSAHPLALHGVQVARGSPRFAARVALRLHTLASHWAVQARQNMTQPRAREHPAYPSPPHAPACGNQGGPSRTALPHWAQRSTWHRPSAALGAPASRARRCSLRLLISWS